MYAGDYWSGDDKFSLYKELQTERDRSSGLTESFPVNAIIVENLRSTSLITVSSISVDPYLYK